MRQLLSALLYVHAFGAATSATTLFLAGNSLTDAAIEPLMAMLGTAEAQESRVMPMLRCVNVSGNAFSADGRARLEAACAAQGLSQWAVSEEIDQW